MPEKQRFFEIKELPNYLQTIDFWVGVKLFWDEGNLVWEYLATNGSGNNITVWLKEQKVILKTMTVFEGKVTLHSLITLPVDFWSIFKSKRLQEKTRSHTQQRNWMLKFYNKFSQTHRNQIVTVQIAEDIFFIDQVADTRKRQAYEKANTLEIELGQG